MAKREIYGDERVVDFSAAVGFGPLKDVGRYNLVGATLHVHCDSGAVQLQVSNDGTNWIDEGAELVASTLVLLGMNVKYIRFETTVAFEGQITLHAFEELH